MNELLSAVDQYLDHLRQRGSGPRHVQVNRNQLRRFSRWVIQSQQITRLADLTPGVFAAWRDYCLALRNFRTGEPLRTGFGAFDTGDGARLREVAGAHGLVDYIHRKRLCVCVRLELADLKKMHAKFHLRDREMNDDVRLGRRERIRLACDGSEELGFRAWITQPLPNRSEYCSASPYFEGA